ncbi:MAG TPA: cytochrome c maturation protein CcmE [Acidiferrobacteraceae bacterium]|nr:cytochrome c maturation protein CcmE [Acidiferrobacteraceae bacterium]
MKARHKRLILALLAITGVAIGTTLILREFKRNLVFYYTPTQIAEGKEPHSGQYRMGGLVERGSIKREGLKIAFTLTDLKTSMRVHYTGILPDLFRAGQGIVVEGRVGHAGVFAARQVLAKHDANYMPPEVAASLKRHEAELAQAKSQSATATR